MTLAFVSMEMLWRNALAAIPLALIVAAICRWVPCRASTRHALWCMVLLSLLTPPFLPDVDLAAAVKPLFASLTNQDAKPEKAIAIDSSKPLVIRPPTPVIAVEKPSAQSHSSSTLSFSPQRPTLAATAPISIPPVRIDPLSLCEAADQTSECEASAETPAAIASIADVFNLINLFGAPSAQATPTESECNQNRCEEPATWDVPGMLASFGIQQATPVKSRIASAKTTLLQLQPIEVQLANSASPPAFVAAPKPTQESASLDSSREPKADESVAMSSTIIQWREWVAGLAAVRDSLVRVTPIPTTLWLMGCATVFLVLAVRTLRFKRVLRSAQPAGRDVQRMVADTARAIGLRTPPQTYISHSRISPMIWCGWERVLLLPQSLWTDLDSTGRRAVLLHELAHLRRRDHWVRWMELVIGCLYWWHPVVWFVRKRLRDEADFCCDAWVTSLLPGGRSAYARALVATRQFISSESHDATPAVGLGIATNRTKRFARRLKMVMTERSTPRLSTMGGIMALSLAAAAWISAPLWACPPESGAAAEKAAEELAQVKAMARIATAAPRAQNEDGSSFEQYMAARELAVAAEAARPGAVGEGAARAPRAPRAPRAAQPAQPPQPPQPPQAPQPPLWRMAAPAAIGDGELQNRIDQLEERLNQLTNHLESLMSQPRGEAPHGEGPRGMFMPATPAPPGTPGVWDLMETPAPSGVTTTATPLPRTLTSTGGVRGYVVGSGSGFGPGMVVGSLASNDDDEVVTRVYQLPEGKSEAFYELMARNDVPVFVSCEDNGISVQATPRQHEVVQSFIALIHPEAAKGGLIRHRLSMGIGQAAQQDAVRSALAKAHKELETTRAVRAREVDALRRSLTDQQGGMKTQIRELQRKAEDFSRKAREFQQRSSRLESQAENAKDDAHRQKLMDEAAALEAQAEAFEAQADATRDQADAIQDSIESMQEQIAQAIEEASAVDEQALEDAISAAADAAADSASDEAATAASEHEDEEGD